MISTFSQRTMHAGRPERLDAILPALMDDLLRDVPARLRASMQAAVHGGKQIRPRLLQAWHLASGGFGPNWIVPATAIELVHRASLVHDDLPCMDADEKRNGRPSVQAHFGAARAVLTGDAMLALAFRTLACVPNAPAMTELLAGTIITMCAGQAGEFEPTRPTAGADDWIECCDQKTGSLFGAACELGVLCAGDQAGGLRSAARAFGHRLGRLYQLADDIADGDPYPLETARRSAAIWDELERIAGAAPDPAPLIALLTWVRCLVQAPSTAAAPRSE